MLQSKPYKLINFIQHYEWGSDNFIPNFIGIKAEQKPYAELWIGGHPKLSSEIIFENKLFKLDQLVKQYPNEILGEFVVKKFGNKIPFLLKVLSAKRALSIQTHPNKLEAKELHLSDSQNYPDDNHKPEIAIALDFLLALVGFRELNEIGNNIFKYPQLLEFIGDEVFYKFLDNKNKAGLKILFSTLMEKSSQLEILEKTIMGLFSFINSKKNKSEDEILFLELYNQYGIDIGLLVLFFLNVIKLNAGEAIYTPSGIPHAYLKGNIVECMANSDNVVRAGLTPKFKDVGRLLKILNYDFGKVKIIPANIVDTVHCYNVDIEEFSIEMIKMENNSISFSTNNRIEILLIVDGEIEIDNLTFKKGEAILIPAKMNSYKTFSKNKSLMSRVSIPG